MTRSATTQQLIDDEGCIGNGTDHDGEAIPCRIVRGQPSSWTLCAFCRDRYEDAVCAADDAERDR